MSQRFKHGLHQSKSCGALISNSGGTGRDRRCFGTMSEEIAEFKLPAEQTDSEPPFFPKEQDAQRFFAGGGEMGSLIRSKDWARTPFGPTANWPQSLRTAISLMLSSGFGMVVAWGPDFRFFYNDRYRPVLGASKHPAALGTPARLIFPEAWNFIGPLFERTRQGESVAFDDVLIPLERYGYLENCYFTLSYSPIRDESGEVGGMLAVVAETTERVQSERRLKTLRDLARRASDFSTVKLALESAAQTLGENPIDVPFVLFYIVEENGERARLESATGLRMGGHAAPEVIDLRTISENQWPLHNAIQSGELRVVENLAARFGDLPGGPYSEPTHTAVLTPLIRPGQPHADGVVIFGVSPRRALDDQYRGFYELAAEHVLTAIRNAVAKQEEHERLNKLVELDRAKTLFFSNVSHEFRTSLTLMLGPLEDVLGRPESKFQPEDQEQLAVVHRNGLRLLKLVNTLLDFSRIEAGRVQAMYEPTDLCQMTADLASGFRSAIERAGLQFRVDCQPLPEAVYVDRDMWEKIVLNLLSNAFKFTFTGKIDVTLKAVGGTVELSVEDTGTGIAEGELHRIFERFHRIEGVQARTHEGTGIGLALVYELAKLHHGSVRVTSEVGTGSIFTVAVPLGKEHLPQDRIEAKRTLESTALRMNSFLDEALRLLPQTSKPENAPASVGAGRNLLFHSGTVQEVSASAVQKLIVLADDNADMRDYVRHLLGEHYTVHAVTNGEEAVQSTMELSPDLVLMDIMMPRLDGFGALKQIRDNPSIRTTPIILLSARAGEESRAEGLEAGADDYLIKPFTARELLARVKTHLAMADIRREAFQREEKLRAEAEMERSRLKQILTQAPAAIAMTDGPEHRFTFINAAGLRLTGRASEEVFLGKTVPEVLPEVERQGLVKVMDQVYRTGQPFVGSDLRVLLNRTSADQPEEGYFNFIYQPIKDLNGQVQGIFTHAIEVTEQVLARKTIEVSEERFRLAQTAAQIGAWEWNPRENMNSLSPELHRMFGTDINDPQHTQVWASRVHPDDWSQVESQMLSGHIRGSMEFEYRYAHPEHGPRWFLCKGRRFKDDDSRMFGVVVDITQRKQAEEARLHLAAIVASADDAIASKDMNGIVTSWNQGAERLFGYKADEMIGRPITVIIPSELLDQERMILDKLRRGERIQHFETERVRKNGTRINVSLTVFPIVDGDGRTIGAARIARDITQRKQAEEALRMAERLASVGRLAATVAHEVNNPLAAVTNLVYLAKNDSSLESVRRYLTVAEEELARVAHLTRQTLGFYREARVATRSKVGPLLEQAVSMFSPRIKNQVIDVRLAIKDDPEILMIAGEIRQLVANLIGNSIDAVALHGRIRIRLSKVHSYKSGASGVRITVGDTGIGIDREIHHRIFDPFFTSKKDVGTGLGLWVSKNIVERHHGAIRFRSSTAPGNSWTVFSVLLPLDGTASEMANPKDALKKAS